MKALDRHQLAALVIGVSLAVTMDACAGGGSVTSIERPPPVSPTPCLTQPAGPASGQTRARLGAYYFDGWSGPLTNYHFNGLLSGSYQGRQPVTGWQDNSSCAVEQQLAWAHKFGIDFFVFDWYFNATINDPGEDLNSAIAFTHALPDRHGMQYAILFVDSDPFVPQATDWPGIINQWMTYMTDPAYVKVNGKPLLIVIDAGQMRNIFGSSAGVNSALAQLRAAAVAKGLAGVFVAAVFGVPEGSSGQDSQFPDVSWIAADGYDALSTYNYPFTPTVVNGALPFASLATAGRWMWSQCALKCPLPAIPVETDGWDPRPWNEMDPTGHLLWYTRTPADVSTDVNNTIILASANAKLQVEPAPAPPMVIMEAWNEFGEGSYILPTVGDGTSYGVSLAGLFGGHRFLGGIGLGFLVGFGVRMLGHGMDRIFGYMGAVLSLAGCVLGNILATVIAVSVHQHVPFMDILARLTPDVAWRVLTEGFNLIDLLFYGIAIYFGYHYSFQKITPDELQALQAAEPEPPPAAAPL